jgi:alkylhydroperoxidase/carboxymuconolactone decarboxylase family protein YurZ
VRDKIKIQNSRDVARYVSTTYTIKARAVRCAPAGILEWHIKQALDCGATENEIIEAVEIGIEMGGGPATVSARFAMNVLKYYGTTK